MSVLCRRGGCRLGYPVDVRVRIRQGRLAHTPGRLSPARPLPLLAVRREVEADEQHEVRANDANTGKRGELLAGAAAHVRHPLEVGRGEVGVRGKVDETCENSQRTRAHATGRLRTAGCAYQGR